MRIVILEGDGIGPEIVAVARNALVALDARFALGLSLETLPVGLAAHRTHGTTFPEASAQAARQADGIVLGPLSSAEYPALGAGGVNASAALRRDLDLFANLRPARARPAIPSAAPGLDALVVRENGEGFYAVRTMYAGSGEMMPDADTAFAVRKITARASARIADIAFAMARRRRRSVVAVHKANVLRLSDGLFLRECRRVAAAQEDIAYREELVDATAASLVQDASRHDVIVTTNLFGDILSNEAAALAGGLGLAGSLNLSDTHLMAQATHGSAPDIAGRGVANPVSILASVAMMLDRLGERRARPALAAAAAALEAAIDATLADPRTRTPDVGGGARTAEVGEAVLRALNHHAETRSRGAEP